MQIDLAGVLYIRGGSDGSPLLCLRNKYIGVMLKVAKLH